MRRNLPHFFPYARLSKDSCRYIPEDPDTFAKQVLRTRNFRKQVVDDMRLTAEVHSSLEIARILRAFLRGEEEVAGTGIETRVPLGSNLRCRVLGYSGSFGPKNHRMMMTSNSCCSPSLAPITPPVDSIIDSDCSESTRLRLLVENMNPFPVHLAVLFQGLCGGQSQNDDDDDDGHFLFSIYPQWSTKIRSMSDFYCLGGRQQLRLEVDLDRLAKRSGLDSIRDFKWGDQNLNARIVILATTMSSVTEIAKCVTATQNPRNATHRGHCGAGAWSKPTLRVPSPTPSIDPEHNIWRRLAVAKLPLVLA